MRNRQFEILLVLAISFVVMGHAGVDFGTIQSLFIYDSYHIPLFMFISGYFYNNDTEFGTSYIKKQIKKLLIPFIILNFFYGIFAIFLHSNFNITFVSGNDFIYKFFIRPFTYGNCFFGLNDPLWYIIMLFEVKIIDYVLKKLLHKWLNTTSLLKFNFVMLILYLIIAVLAITYSRNTVKLSVEYSIIRDCYMIFFYQLGYIYKIAIEKYDNVGNCTYFGVILFVQLYMKYITCDERLDAAIWNATFAHNAFITIITAINGIAFFLRLSRILLPLHNEYISYISRHTFGIMAHHLLSFFEASSECVGKTVSYAAS